MSHSDEDGPDGRTEGFSRFVRIGHAERDAAIEALRRAAGEGRITLDELEERMERIESALFPSALDEVLADITSELPSTRIRAEFDSDRTGELATPGHSPGWSAEDREILHAPLAGFIRRGRWPVTPYLRCEPAGVLLELNFLEVITDLKVIDIEVAARSGTLRLVVPEGWGVDITNLERRAIAVITFKANEAAREGCPTIRVGGRLGYGVLQALLPNRRQRRKMNR